ncbi:tetratricopeptide repeat protein [Hymenobacter sp. ASUV-10]|uniref:Tetratricopeptide repeat protein n=1 Tax=Hymenobacter aranciens TaxID=3063996 RepID=A0ABT9B4I3_9BACT|nr:tetratricopeptide repeat protein [Hymenobacter sp. ASUV-10]MDO7873165.1 tetratricopeptide repeat protein [Hymenobacter sp. ASUV-10]
MSTFFVRLGCWVLLLAGSFQAWSQGAGKNYRHGPNDSLLAQLKRPSTPDTMRVLLLSQLGALASRTDLAAAKGYGEQAIALGQRIGYRKHEAKNLSNLAAMYYNSGNYPAAQRYFTASIVLAKQQKLPTTIGFGYVGLANVASALGDHRRALQHFEEARQYFVTDQPNQAAAQGQMLILGNMANEYVDLNDLPEHAPPATGPATRPREPANGP